MIILSEAKIKYIILDNLIRDKVLENQLLDTNVNVIIDLKEIIRKCYRNNVIEEERITGDQTSLIKEISSDIINTIGHYRNYFVKIKKYTTFYLLYSKDKCENLINEYSTYKEDTYNKYYDENSEFKTLNTIIEKTINVISSVVKIIPHAYFIDTSDYDENLWIKYLLSSFSKNTFNMIMTNDDLLKQHVGRNTIILTMKGDNSKMITSDNLLEIILDNLKIEPKFASSLYTLMLSISGIKKYNINGLNRHGYGKAVKRLNYLVDKDKIIDVEILDLDILKEILKEEFSNDETEIIIKNYKIITSDLLIMQYNNLLFKSLLAKYKIKENISENNIYDINDKFFTTDYYLNLEMIFKGEKI